MSVSKVASAVASFVACHVAQHGRATAVLEALTADGVDITSRTAVSAVITPLVASEYGVKLQTAERVSKNGSKVFPKNAKGEAARTCRDALLRGIFGESAGHKPAAPVKVTRAMHAAAVDFLALCGSKAAALAAIKALK